MSRYYYYLILINTIANIIACVPAVLLHYHHQGAISAMIIASITGPIIIALYTRFFNTFPGITLPELLQKTTKKWFYNPFLLFLAVTWFVAGLITLITFSFLLIRFLSPEMSIILISLTIIIPVIFGSLMKTDRVLYTIEIILVITFPLILFIFLKSYTNEYIRWDFVKDAALYFNQMPNLDSFSAAFFLFLGPANLIIFNRFFTNKQNFGLKQATTLFLVITTALFTTYFIPVGFNGSEHIKDLVYPWITTSDSLRIKYGLVERVLFLFLLFYLGIAFLSILIHWHVAMEFLKFIFKLDKIKYKNFKIGVFLPVPFFIGISLYLVRVLNEYQLYRYSAIFYNFLAIAFVLMVFLFFFIKRRMKYAKQAEQN